MSGVLGIRDDVLVFCGFREVREVFVSDFSPCIRICYIALAFCRVSLVTNKSARGPVKAE